MFYAMYLKIVLYFVIVNLRFPKIKVTIILTIYPFVSFQHGGYSSRNEIGSSYILKLFLLLLIKEHPDTKSGANF